MYDETTHWRLRKPKVGEKYVSVAQFKECLTYYALANGFFLWKFNFGSLVNYKWIAKVLGEKIRDNPDIRLCHIADLVMKKYKCKVLCVFCWTDGWKAGCRKIIALDGCFLKSPNQGEILTAIGRDGDNHIYLVAWAVVNVENKDNWTWFLELLEQDLGSIRGNGLTLMSNQHKGLIEAVKDVMPNAEHGQCARDIYENFRKQYLGLEFRQLEISRKWNPGVCPNIKRRLEWLKEQQRFWHVIPVGGNLFEVRSGSKGFTVDEGKRTYSCRMWRLSGIHCIHATKVIFLINRVPESYVPAWFEIDMYFVTYHNYVKLVPGMNLWPDQSIYFTVLPPKPRKTSVDDVEDVDVVQRGPVRDEGDGGSRGGARGSRGR
ncbi:multidrug resistance-associated protein 5 [Tanacetum coccineum]